MDRIRSFVAAAALAAVACGDATGSASAPGASGAAAAASGPTGPGPAARIDLAAHERSVFSQFGEDGVIEKLFEVIEPGPRFCVEFGAGDGKTSSNMRNLVVNHGWSSLQIEGNPKRAEALRRNYEGIDRVTALEAWVWPGNIEILFEENGVPEDLDLLVIDIDSNDYYVWRAIHAYRPKVVIIEANPLFPPPQRAVVDYHPMNYWDGTSYLGASAQSLYELGKRKGYELVYQLSDGPNIVFVDAKYYDRFGIDDNRPVTIASRVNQKARERFAKFGGLDGQPWVEGKDTLVWRNLRIPKRFVLDRR